MHGIPTCNSATSSISSLSLSNTWTSKSSCFLLAPYFSSDIPNWSTPWEEQDPTWPKPPMDPSWKMQRNSVASRNDMAEGTIELGIYAVHGQLLSFRSTATYSHHSHPSHPKRNKMASGKQTGSEGNKKPPMDKARGYISRPSPAHHFGCYHENP